MNTIHGPSFCGISTSLGKDVEMLVLCWTFRYLRRVCVKTGYMLVPLLIWDVRQR